MGCSACNRSTRPSVILKKQSLNEPLSISNSTFTNKSKTSSLQNYKFISKLGSGAFADVHLTLYIPLSQYRALKSIHKSGLHLQQIDEAFLLQEFKILSSLDHPNITKCYEIFEDTWKYYISMEYCAGGELFEKISSFSKFTESQAAEIIFQVFSALSYCHDKNVIHRDIKPENILLEEKGESFQIKLTDFGSSCFFAKNQELSGCFGTAYYVAPEVLNGNYNEKSDIWAVGIIMYVMLTGKPPYQGTDERVILDQIQQSPLIVSKSYLPSLSQSAFDLLQGLLEINPKKRLNAKQALSHNWVEQHKSSKPGLDLTGTLNELSSFSACGKLKNAVRLFLATQVIAQNELKVLKEEFLAIDKDGNGRISREELLEQYKKIMNEPEATEVVNEIMNKVDVNHSGDIDYTEFLAGCMEKSNFESKENLNLAFNLFDKDGSGDITVHEIQAVLGGGQMVDNKVWADIIKEVDENGDGVIDLREFILLMTRKF